MLRLVLVSALATDNCILIGNGYKMVRCTLKPATKVVVGNGQSAQCSQYLTYPVSDKLQVYIVDAENVVVNCAEFDAVMSWK